VVTYLLVVTVLLAVFWSAGVAVFYLRFMRLQRRQVNVVNETDVQHLAADLSTQAMHLDELRLWLFLEWLQCHCCGDSTQWINQDGDEIRKFLCRWLERFSPDDLHAEHELILTEITWWKMVDEKTLLRCIGKELTERRLSQ
jgi:hypothetical protein